MNSPATPPVSNVHSNPAAHAPAEAVDLKEYGAPKEGRPQISDKRLFFQLHVFTGCHSHDALVSAVQASGLEAVLYANFSDPRGIGILTFAEDPAVFTTTARKLLSSGLFSALTLCPEFTMSGRTYAAGREADLEDWLLKKPRRNALNKELKWAVWYPLRRKSEFELLSKDEQTKILYEHAKIGMSYGMSGFAHDIRLACHGLDKNDNEFVLGILAPELFPISRLVQDMRKTQQTGRYMQSMGPFFIGKVLFQTPLKRE